MFAPIGALLDECKSGVDVGAGSGALALPLARRLSRVTAVEPSAAMAKALREAARRQGLENVTVIEAGWDEAAVEPHDLVVCAHVSHLLTPGSRFLSRSASVARRGIVVIRDAPGGQDKFFFGELYPVLLGRPYMRRCDYPETLQTLLDLGIVPRVGMIEYASDQPFDSLDEACEFWMEHMGLEGAAAHAFLSDFLARRLERAGASWVAPYRKLAAVISWDTAPEEA